MIDILRYILINLDYLCGTELCPLYVYVPSCYTAALGFILHTMQLYKH